MDFIPAGYLTIRDAVDRILRSTHGDDWGEKEVEFETGAMDGLTVVDNDGPSKGQPLDRKTVAVVRHQVSDAEESLLSSLIKKKLEASIENGPPVPQSYWQSTGASATIGTGILILGAGAKPEDQKWQHHRVLLKIKKFDAWLGGSPTGKIQRSLRKHDEEQDALIRNKIESVLAAAKRKWPSYDQVPGRNQMARLLAVDDTVKNTGYKEATIRKILSGSYPSSQKHNIPGYPDTNIQKK